MDGAFLLKGILIHKSMGKSVYLYKIFNESYLSIKIVHKHAFLITFSIINHDPLNP